MSDTQRHGGFAGHAATALSVTGTGGCCGNPPQVTIAPPAPAAVANPCCGTAAEAQAEGACCGTAARSDAVATGAGCCG